VKDKGGRGIVQGTGRRGWDGSVAGKVNFSEGGSGTANCGIQGVGGMQWLAQSSREQRMVVSER